MIFGRVKPLDAILATAEKKSLHRSLGAFQLTLFGIGCIIGTGIFVLTAAGAQKAGPGLMLSFVIAGAVCVVAALCYAEIAAMVPVAGSAYTYTYAVMGEFLAWTVGWALVLEYAIAASAVSVGWSGYFSGTILEQTFGIDLPDCAARRAARARRRRRRPLQPAGLRHRPAGHLAADDRHHRERARQRGAGDDQDHRADRLHRAHPADGRPGQFQSVHAGRLLRGRRRRRRSAPRRRSSSPMSASTRSRPRPRRPRTRSATCRSA